MKTFAIQSCTNPEIGMAVTVNENDYEKAKIFANAALAAWLGDDEEREKYFSDDPEAVDYMGYSEPVDLLLSEKNIEHKIEECFDYEGEWLPGWEEREVEIV